MINECAAAPHRVQFCFGFDDWTAGAGIAKDPSNGPQATLLKLRSKTGTYV